jgi:hypothetical protein
MATPTLASPLASFPPPFSQPLLHWRRDYFPIRKHNFIPSLPAFMPLQVSSRLLLFKHATLTHVTSDSERPLERSEVRALITARFHHRAQSRESTGELQNVSQKSSSPRPGGP